MMGGEQDEVSWHDTLQTVLLILILVILVTFAAVLALNWTHIMAVWVSALTQTITLQGRIPLR